MEDFLYDCKGQSSFAKTERKTDARTTIIKIKTMHHPRINDVNRKGKLKI